MTIPATSPPKWTVHYNIASNYSRWVGRGWEFFDDEECAEARYNALNSMEGHCASMRPFHRKTDAQHLGAVHRNERKGI